MAGRSNSYDLLILGGDVVELAAALDTARLGFRVLTVDIPESEYMPQVIGNTNEVVREICSSLGIDTFVERDPEGQQQVLGIPANPFSEAVRVTLGTSGCWRVYLDRLRPLLRIGNDTNLQRLVSKRMGAKAWAQLVLPELERRFGRFADQVSITVAAPGLIEATSRVGSLSSGVIEYILADQRVAERVVIAGGVSALRDGLRKRLGHFAGERMTVEKFLKKSISARTVMVGCGSENLLGQLSETRRTELLSAPLRNIGLSVDAPGYESAIPRAYAAGSELRALLMTQAV